MLEYLIASYTTETLKNRRFRFADKVINRRATRFVEKRDLLNGRIAGTGKEFVCGRDRNFELELNLGMDIW